MNGPLQPICLHFVRRIYRERADAMTARYLPDQSQIRSICMKCLRGRAISLPTKYADLGGLARCYCCAQIADCRDPDVLRRYAAAGIPPSTVFLHYPTLRHPLNGDRIHMGVVDALILAATGGEQARH